MGEREGGRSREMYKESFNNNTVKPQKLKCPEIVVHTNAIGKTKHE